MVVSTLGEEMNVSECTKDLTLKQPFTQSPVTEGLTAVGKEPRYKNIVHLWEFLLELLAQDSCKSIITWSRKEYREFRLKNPEQVALRWGRLKGKKGMNYDKLSRALRYYYQQGIIKKVPGQRLVYKFHKLPYKYEPGVTRSLSYTKQNTTVNNEQDRKPVTTPPPHVTPGFSPLPSKFIPTSIPVRKDWSWPVVPMPTRPFVWYSGSSPQFKRADDITRSRIIFPFVDMFTPLPLGLKPVEPVSPIYEAFPISNTSVPVSVIQRTV